MMFHGCIAILWQWRCAQITIIGRNGACLNNKDNDNYTITVSHQWVIIHPSIHPRLFAVITIPSRGLEFDDSYSFDLVFARASSLNSGGLSSLNSVPSWSRLSWSSDPPRPEEGEFPMIGIVNSGWAKGLAMVYDEGEFGRRVLTSNDEVTSFVPR